MTPLVIGAILGIIFIMCQQMLIIFAIFVDRSKIPGESPTVIASQQAVAVFAFFLFLVYAAFGALLATFRDVGLSKGKANYSIYLIGVHHNVGIIFRCCDVM